MEQFTALLEADERFEMDPGIDHAEGFPEGEQEQERALMENLGFYSGPRVKLRSREITREHLARMLERSTGRMVEALEGAWEHRPPDDQEAEEQLLDLLAMAQRLQREVMEALSEDEAEPGN